MTSQEAYALILKWVNEPITGNVSEADFEAFFHSAQIEHMNFLVGKKQSYQQGNPEPPVQDGQTLAVSLSLSPWKKSRIITLSKGIGTFDPGDLFHGPTTVMASGYKNKCGEQVKVQVNERVEATMLNDDEWAIRTQSYWNAPKLENPVWRFFDHMRVQVSPLNITHLEMSYYKNPDTISVANNTVIKWLNGDVMNILYRVLKQCGVNLTDQQALEFGIHMERSQS